MNDVYLFTRYWEKSTLNASVRNCLRLMDIPTHKHESLKGIFPHDIEVIVDSKGNPDDCFLASPLLVISEKLKNVFDEFSVNSEYFAVSVEDRDGRKLNAHYFHPNILELVDCFNWSESLYTKEKGFATKINRTTLKRIKAVPPLFYVSKTIPRILCVRGDVLERMKEVGYSGPDFVRETEWKGFGDFIYV